MRRTLSPHFLALVLMVTAAAQVAAAQEDGGGFSAGGPADDAGRDLVFTAADEPVVVGVFRETADFGGIAVTAADDDPDADWGDAFVAAFDRSGGGYWVRRIGSGTADDSAERVAIGPDGALYVAGTFAGTATWDGGAHPDVLLTAAGGHDAFLAKYTAGGDLAWVRTGGGSGQDIGRGVAVGENGGVYFTGSFEAAAAFGTGASVSSAGGRDAFLARYDEDGDLLWLRSAGGDEDDDAWNVTIDQGNYPNIVGSFRSVALVGDHQIESQGLSDAFVARYSPSGVALWAHAYGGAGDDYGRGVAPTSNPFLSGWGLYALGEFESTISLGQNVLESAGASDVFVAIVELASGTPTRGLRLGGPEADAGADIAKYDGVNAYVTGHVSGPATVTHDLGTFNWQTDGEDAFLMRVGVNGNNAFYAVDYPVGGEGDDRGYGVYARGDNTTVGFTGAFQGTVLLFPYSHYSVTLESVGGSDISVGFEINCGICVSIHPDEPPTASLSAPSPNPFHETATLTLTLTAPQPVHAEVVDLLGRRVALLHDGLLGAGPHTLTWDAEATPPGVYVVRITAGAETLAQKVSRLR